VPAGDHVLKWGGVRNPRSTAPTGIFNITIADAAGNAVAAGSIDTIQMTTPGSFKVLTIKQASTTVGANTDYLVTFTAEVPLNNNDQLVIDFPPEIGLPAGEGKFCETIAKNCASTV
tara:strand:- start:665 stop:1015 length:351 start_codon:yes stop_codon:yes gene_type:complete